MFHFIEGAIDVARFKLNSAAAVQDDVRVQSEVACIERAVFHAVIQGKSEQVNVLDPALFEVMGEPGVAAMSVIEERAVAVNPWIDPFVENVSDAAGVE